MYQIKRTTVKSIRIKKERPEWVYNLRIKNNRNYFANKILVHNCDDPNNTTDGDSEVKRESAIAWYGAAWSFRFNDIKTGSNIVIQQRLHNQDISGFLLSQEDSTRLVKLILPMEFEPYRHTKTIILPSTQGKVWEDPRTEIGELLWPEKVGAQEVARIKIGLGSSYNISGQLQQRPTPEGGGIIKDKWFLRWNQAKPPVLMNTIQSIDTAYGLREFEDNYSAITTWGYFKHEGIDSIILLNLWRGRLEYPYLRKLCQDLFDDYRNDGTIDITPDGRHRVDMMLVEGKASGDSLIQDLRKAGINAVRFDPTKHGDKEKRVHLATPIIENGLVWVPSAPPDFRKLRNMSAQLIKHCVEFPKEDSRDVVDTMSQVILYLQQSGLLNHRLNPKAIAELTRPLSYYWPDEYMQ
jgi:predicted phage terminase large subunit-like protein